MLWDDRTLLKKYLLFHVFSFQGRVRIYVEKIFIKEKKKKERNK